MGAALERHYAPGKPVSVIPNARRPESFAPGTKEPFVLAVGRLWDEAKNLAALDAAAPSLSWPVRVAGELRQPGGGSEARARHTVALGRLAPEEVAAWMGRAAVYALPARYEPFGLSALEAGLAGCSLVLGDIPSLREVWGDAALFVPPDDPRALVSTLTRLGEDVGLRERFAARARARALTYTPRRMVEAYLALYASLPRSRPVRPGMGLALGAP
ncbi:glycosyltransferase family 4 protein [Myxococcus stipitatus]|uniref:glycosyltransferase family 4 protein n=1 Tax=Myxococcus stipitatus TaxID=83455 RepID=UPI002DD42FDA|nr:glycosyltransferase family 4 protein [Myxococcus stipitatus]